MNFPETLPLNHKPSRTILLVEDNDDAIMLAERAVNKVDPSLRLVVARSAEEAMDAFKGAGGYAGPAAETPFMVLFDLKLPGSQGLGLIRRFRDNPRTQDAALVVLSASATRDEAALLEGADSPADAFLVKPITTSQMAALVAKYRPKANP